jgi:hypothetical protein
MKSLFPMLLKFHQHLHPLVEFSIPKQDIDVDSNLDIFDMITNCSELMNKLVNVERLSCKHYHVDIKNVKCHL